MKRCQFGQLLDVRTHLLRAERAVQTDAEQRKVRDGIEEGLRGLPGQRAAAQIGDRARHHDRQADFLFGKIFRDGEERRLAIERVENCFNQEEINPAFDQFVDLLSVRRRHLLEGHLAGAGIVHIARDGQGLAHRPDCAGDKNPAVRAGVRRLAGQPRRGQIQIGNQRLHPVVGLRNGRAIEGVRFDQVRARRDVLLVDAADDVRLGQDEQVVVAFDVARPIFATLPTVSRLVQLVPLDHRAHRPVEINDALGQQSLQRLSRIRLCHGQG